MHRAPQPRIDAVAVDSRPHSTIEISFVFKRCGAVVGDRGTPKPDVAEAGERRHRRGRRRLAVGSAFVVSLAVGTVARTRAEPTMVGPATKLSDDQDEIIPACATEVRLSGTVYDAAHPERSFALLHLAPKGWGEVYREGASIRGLEIQTIEPEGVLMRGETGSCWLNITRMPGKKQSRGIVARTPPRHFTLTSSTFSPAELGQAIRATGPHAYDIERSLIDRAIGRAPQLVRSTRFDQVQHHGAVAGLELRGFAKNGLLARLGLMRGDVLKSLNGVPLTNVDNERLAQKLVESTPRLSLLVMREGQPLTLDYHVVD